MPTIISFLSNHLNINSLANQTLTHELIHFKLILYPIAQSKESDLPVWTMVVIFVFVSPTRSSILIKQPQDKKKKETNQNITKIYM